MAHNYERILVGFDDSEGSKLALKRASELAKEHKAKLYIARVYDKRIFQSNDILSGDYTEPITQSLQATIEEYVEVVKNDYGHQNVEGVLQFGSPRTAMSRTIPEEYNIDLVVVGATGQSGITRALLGSVAERVARMAPCDVLIVRS